MSFWYNEGERVPYAATLNGEHELYLYYDQVGSLRVVADKYGRMVKEIRYSAFGVIEEDTNPDLYMPIGFAGGLHDRDVGFVRFGFRDYDPVTARFTAKDPLGYAAGDSDLYGYCFDDPVNGIDPLGLEADCLSLDVNAAGFGLRGEMGAGVCWDDKGEIRGMGHIDGGAGSGWGAGASGTWQSTDAKSVDDLAGQSMIVGKSVSAPTPWGVSVSGGYDKVYGDGYEGDAYSVGVGGRTPWIPAEGHAMQQNTGLWGGKKRK